MITIGGHAWGPSAYVWKCSEKCIILAPVPSQLARVGITYADLRTRCQFVGPGLPSFALYEAQASRAPAEGATAIGYVPEGGGDWAQNVPVEETTDLEDYVVLTSSLAQSAGLTYVYGPGTALLRDPPDQDWGRLWTLDYWRISRLAALLPSDAQWIIRAHNAETGCRATGETCFRCWIRDYETAIHSGNANIGVHVHLSLPPDGVAAFEQFVQWLDGLEIAGVYAGLGPLSDGAELMDVLGE